MNSSAGTLRLTIFNETTYGDDTTATYLVNIYKADKDERLFLSTNGIWFQWILQWTTPRPPQHLKQVHLFLKTRWKSRKGEGLKLHVVLGHPVTLPVPSFALSYRAYRVTVRYGMKLATFQYNVWKFVTDKGNTYESVLGGPRWGSYYLIARKLS